MSSLFKKRKNPNIRHRRTGDEEDEENDNDVGSLNPLDRNKDPFKQPLKANVHSKKEKKKNKEKSDKKNVLSFEDELEADDGITFQEKKSSLSYKLRKEMKKERKEKRKEERLKSDAKDKNKGQNSSLSVSELDDLGIKIVNGREAEAIGYYSGGSDEDETAFHPKHIFKPRKQEECSLQPWKAALQGGKIPDANLIHQIRKQRQKARERGDVIPVDDTVRFEETKGRLIRDDDNDHSDDDEDRIKFSVNQEEVDRKQRREAFEAAQAERGESDHDSEWEMQQLKKAGASAKLATDAVEGIHDSVTDMNIQTAYYGNGLPVTSYSSYIAATTEPAWGSLDSFLPHSSSLPRPANYQAEGIIKRLQDSRASIDEVHCRHRIEADAIIDTLVTSKATVMKCTNDRDPQTESFKFYQDMRGYVTDLRECLNEKLAEIKKLEEQINLIYRQRTQKIIYRRRQDVKDQNNEFSPFAGKLAKGDEYRIRRSAEREGRRTRRRRERERKGEVSHHDGMSTDDEESQSEHNLMLTEISNIVTEANKIFEDVEDDFSQLRRVVSRFEEWRQVDIPSYNDAYVSYNLPKIMAPFIRLNLLMWNPLNKQEDTIDVERLSWFYFLFTYGVISQEEVNLERFKDDPDRRLTSNIVERIILPKIKDLVSCSWDPLSHVQSVRLVNLVRHYASTYPTIRPNSKQLVELTQAIMGKIKDCIENDVFVPMFPKNVYENKNSGVSLFFQRQFWSAWKLLGSVLMWHRILNDSIIHELAIRSLLNLYLLPALNLAAELNVKDSLEKTRNVINVLPREWSKQEDGIHAFLGRLEFFLVTMAEKLDPALHNFEIKEICDLLKSVGAKSQAEKIDNKYL